MLTLPRWAKPSPICAPRLNSLGPRQGDNARWPRSFFLPSRVPFWRQACTLPVYYRTIPAHEVFFAFSSSPSPNRWNGKRAEHEHRPFDKYTVDAT